MIPVPHLPASYSKSSKRLNRSSPPTLSLIHQQLAPIHSTHSLHNLGTDHIEDNSPSIYYIVAARGYSSDRAENIITAIT
jgi:hypothetical protein